MCVDARLPPPPAEPDEEVAHDVVLGREDRRAVDKRNAFIQLF